MLFTIWIQKAVFCTASDLGIKDEKNFFPDRKLWGWKINSFNPEKIEDESVTKTAQCLFELQSQCIIELFLFKLSMYYLIFSPGILLR